MGPFAGIDPFSWDIGDYISGKGYFVVPDEAEDGDDRDAATAMVLAQGAINRTNWIAWRMVNGIEDGSYTAAITWSGQQNFTGATSATFANFVQFNGDVTFADVDVLAKRIEFNGAAVAIGDTPAANAQYKENILRAKALIETDGAGGATVKGGFNVSATVTVTATYLEITFKQAFPDAWYSCVVSDADYPSAIPATVWGATRTTTTIRVSFQAYGGGAVNPSTNVVRFSLLAS